MFRRMGLYVLGSLMLLFWQCAWADDQNAGTAHGREAMAATVETQPCITEFSKESILCAFDSYSATASMGDQQSLAIFYTREMLEEWISWLIQDDSNESRIDTVRIISNRMRAAYNCNAQERNVIFTENNEGHLTLKCLQRVGESRTTLKLTYVLEPHACGRLGGEHASECRAWRIDFISAVHRLD